MTLCVPAGEESTVPWQESGGCNVSGGNVVVIKTENGEKNWQEKRGCNVSGEPEESRVRNA